jgi:hypothetical protein
MTSGRSGLRLLWPDDGSHHGADRAARQRRHQGKRREARDLLAPIYGAPKGPLSVGLIVGKLVLNVIGWRLRRWRLLAERDDLVCGRSGPVLPGLHEPAIHSVADTLVMVALALRIGKVELVRRRNAVNRDRPSPSVADTYRIVVAAAQPNDFASVRTVKEDVRNAASRDDYRSIAVAVHYQLAGTAERNRLIEPRAHLNAIVATIQHGCVHRFQFRRRYDRSPCH